MGPWLRPRPVDALLLSQPTVHVDPIGALSLPGVLSVLRPAIVQTNCTDAFTI